MEGEATPANPLSSTYDRQTVQLKIFRVWGSVSGFQQRQSAKFVNALEAEIVGSIEGLADLFEWSVLYGNDVDTYQTSGIDTYIAEDSTAQKTIALGGSVADLNANITLSDLDDVLDAVETSRGTQNDPKIIIASPQAISYISGLQSKIQRNVQTIEYEGGFRMATYRGVPMMPSGFLRPAGTTTSPAVTATAAAGGSLADDEWFYAISSVTKYGEQIMGTEDSATTATTNNSVDLTWTADSNALLYKIWRGTATGVFTLLTTIAAKSYDSAGTLSTNVAAWSDEGTLTPVSSLVPLEASEESIFVVNLNPQRGAALVGNMSPLGDPIDTFVTYTPLATTKSTFDYMIESFMALKVPYPQLHAVLRRVRLG